jgi:hypothetical protein
MIGRIAAQRQPERRFIWLHGPDNGFCRARMAGRIAVIGSHRQDAMFM